MDESPMGVLPPTQALIFPISRFNHAAQTIGLAHFCNITVTISIHGPVCKMNVTPMHVCGKFYNISEPMFGSLLQWIPIATHC